MNNIALFGAFCAGKTTLARAFEDEFGYTRVSMAFNLKNIATEVYGTTDKVTLVRCTEPDGAGTHRSFREVLQKLGEAVKSVDRDFWLRWFLKDTQYISGPLVLDDARLLFEAQELRLRGWVLVKIDTPRDLRIARHINLYGREPSEAELTHKTEGEFESIHYDYIVDGALDPIDLAYRLFPLINEGYVL